MRKGLFALLAVLAIVMVVPLQSAEAADVELSGHAKNDSIEATYMGGSEFGRLYLTLAEKPSTDVRVLVYSTADVQVVDKLPAERNLPLEIKPLKEQTYTVLVSSEITGDDLASIDIVIGYNTMVKVTVLPGEGTGASKVTEVISGGSYFLPENSFTAPEGKVFDRWSVNGNTYLPGQPITVSSDTTVTALWTESHGDDNTVMIAAIIAAVIVVLFIVVVILIRRH